MDATLTALYAMTVGDALGRVPLPVQLLVAGLLVGSAGWAAVRPGALPVVALVACTLMWARANQRLEGPVLWTLSPGHGLVVADLLPPALVAGVVLLRLRARRTAVPRHAAPRHATGGPARCERTHAADVVPAGVPRPRQGTDDPCSASGSASPCPSPCPCGSSGSPPAAPSSRWVTSTSTSRSAPGTSRRP